MSHNLELGSNLILRRPTRSEDRKAAIRIAAQIAAEHPGLTAQKLAADPAIVAGMRELLSKAFHASDLQELRDEAVTNRARRRQ